MVEITDLGIIKGGVCEGLFKMRKQRESGCQLAWDATITEGCVSISKGWFKVNKLPKYRKYGEYGSANHEIGFYRMMNDVLATLIRTKQKFRHKWMEKWILDIASFEFGVQMEDPFTVKAAGYAKPHLDETYQKWNTR